MRWSPPAELCDLWLRIASHLKGTAYVMAEGGLLTAVPMAVGPTLEKIRSVAEAVGITSEFAFYVNTLWPWVMKNGNSLVLKGHRFHYAPLGDGVVVAEEYSNVAYYTGPYGSLVRLPYEIPVIPESVNKWEAPPGLVLLCQWDHRTRDGLPAMVRAEVQVWFILKWVEEFGDGTFVWGVVRLHELRSFIPERPPAIPLVVAQSWLPLGPTTIVNINELLRMPRDARFWSIEAPNQGRPDMFIPFTVDTVERLCRRGHWQGFTA